MRMGCVWYSAASASASVLLPDPQGPSSTASARPPSASFRSIRTTAGTSVPRSSRTTR